MCKFCNEYIKCRTISTVDKVKEAFIILGWDGNKSEESRLALSNIKDMSTKLFDHPYKYVSKCIEDFKKSNDEILFIHSREPEEIDRFVKDFNCITLLVKNPNIKQIKSNHADANVDDYNYDFIIENDGSLDDLRIKAKEFISKLEVKNEI